MRISIADKKILTDPVLLPKHGIDFFAGIEKNPIVGATHMKALDHCAVSREDLRSHAQKNGIPKDRLLIPEDGQTLVF